MPPDVPLTFATRSADVAWPEPVFTPTHAWFAAGHAPPIVSWK
jgi:hypothetical protein